MKAEQKKGILEIVERLLDDSDHGIENFYFIVWEEESLGICGYGDIFKAIEGLLAKAQEEGK